MPRKCCCMLASARQAAPCCAAQRRQRQVARQPAVNFSCVCSHSPAACMHCSLSRPSCSAICQHLGHLVQLALLHREGVHQGIPVGTQARACSGRPGSSSSVIMRPAFLQRLPAHLLVACPCPLCQGARSPLSPQEAPPAAGRTCNAACVTCARLPSDSTIRLRLTTPPPG